MENRKKNKSIHESKLLTQKKQDDLSKTQLIKKSCSISKNEPNKETINLKVALKKCEINEESTSKICKNNKKPNNEILDASNNIILDKKEFSENLLKKNDKINFNEEATLKSQKHKKKPNNEISETSKYLTPDENKFHKNPEYKHEKEKKGDKDPSYFSSLCKHYNHEVTEKILIRMVDCGSLNGLRKLRLHKIENLSCLNLDFSRNSFEDENDIKRFFSHVAQVRRLKKLKLGFSNISSDNIKFVRSEVYNIKFNSEEMEKYSLNMGNNDNIKINCHRIGLPQHKRITSLNFDFSLNTVKNLDKMLERDEIKNLSEIKLNLYGCTFSSYLAKNEENLIKFFDALLKLNKLKKVQIDLRKNSVNKEAHSFYLIDCLESLISVFREKFKNDKKLFRIIY